MKNEASAHDQAVIKEQFVEDVREFLYGRGAEDVTISTTQVNKLKHKFMMGVSFISIFQSVMDLMSMN